MDVILGFTTGKMCISVKVHCQLFPLSSDDDVHCCELLLLFIPRVVLLDTRKKNYLHILLWLNLQPKAIIFLQSITQFRFCHCVIECFANWRLVSDNQSLGAATESRFCRNNVNLPGLRSSVVDGTLAISHIKPKQHWCVLGVWFPVSLPLYWSASALGLFQCFLVLF